MGASITRAMRVFAGWASDRPYRLILLTIVCVHLLAPVAAALLVVDTLRRGPVAATTSALAALAGLSVLGLALGSELNVSLSLTAPFIFGGVACGSLLVWSRSLSLAFQVAVVGAIGVALTVLALIPEARQIGDILQNQVLSLLETGGAGPDQLTQFGAVASDEFVRVFLISVLASLLTAMMLGFWWYSLIGEDVKFGADFRGLKLGRFAGIALMVLVIVRQLVESQLLYYVAPMAIIGFLFQGLAVLHARRYSDKWPRAVIVIVYVALISPWTFVVLMSLSAVGLIDNFFELRARVEPEG